MQVDIITYTNGKKRGALNGAKPNVFVMMKSLSLIEKKSTNRRIRQRKNKENILYEKLKKNYFYKIYIVQKCLVKQ